MIEHELWLRKLSSHRECLQIDRSSCIPQLAKPQSITVNITSSFHLASDRAVPLILCKAARGGALSDIRAAHIPDRGTRTSSPPAVSAVAAPVVRLAVWPALSSVERREQRWVPPLASEQPGPEGASRFFFRVPGALLAAWHAAHYLINVLTAARPRCFLTHFAGDGTTHTRSPFNNVNC